MTETDDPELGITEEDRRKMGELAGRFNRDGSSHNQDGGIPATDHPVVKAVRVEVAWLSTVDDISYIKAKHVARGLEYDSREVGQALARLEREGMLEKDSRRHRTTRYRITLGGDQA